MTTRWKYQAGEYGDRVSVYQDGEGDNIYCRLRDKETGKYIRRSLRHADRKKAMLWADRAAKQLAEGRVSEPVDRLTWARLLALYHQFETPKKALSGQRDDERQIEMWTRLLGGGRDPSDLTFRDLETFVTDRSSGRIDARGNRVTCDSKSVRTRTVQADLNFLNIVLNWATRWQFGGAYLLQENPMRGFRIPSEKNPRRPVATHDRLERLLEVASALQMEVIWSGARGRHPTYLAELLCLVDATGRRIGAVCRLHCRDIRPDLGSNGSIVWPAATDKKGIESTIPMSAEARATIDDCYARVHGEGYLFPAPRDRLRPIRVELASKWLREAEKLAGLKPHEGSLWHAYRRKFATERKHEPIQDLAWAGGWKDLQTLGEVYQQPDEATLLRVLSEPTRLREK